jgi:hypothetical protein
MTTGVPDFAGRALAGLRRLKEAERGEEYCDLCSAALPPEHKHFVQSVSHRLICTCNVCSLLLSGAEMYRAVGPAIQRLYKLDISDAEWRILGIPVGLAFFYITDDRNVIAVYPSPAGPVRAQIDVSDWKATLGALPVFENLKPLVESVLIDRNRDTHCCLVPIDRCYELIGTIRRLWQGFSGGAAVQQEIQHFFENLQQETA